MDEDEVNPDDTEIWDAPELPDHLDDAEHEAPEVSELTPAEITLPETSDAVEFETPGFEVPEADEFAEVTAEAPAPLDDLDPVAVSEDFANDFAHEPAVFETESAEDLPGVSFETEEIPEYLDDVGTEVADVTEVDDAEPAVTELDGDAFETPDFAAAEVDEVLDTRPFNYQPESRQFPGPGHATANTYWMG